MAPIPQHSRVRFAVDSIYLPEPASVLRELFGSCQMTGRIIDFSDSGAAEDRFAIVDVPGLSRPVVVPVEALSVT